MLPSRRASAILTIGLAGISAGFAQAAPASSSAWGSLFDGTPHLWGCVFMAAIVAAALLVQAVFVLQASRVNPPAFTGALTRAIRSGNYQEAWETCQRWRQAAIARMLQPALERIGQGREHVAARLADEARREQKRIDLLLWCMAGAAATAFSFCLATMAADRNNVALASLSPDAPRASAAAAGDIVILGAIGAAIITPAAAAFLWLRARARRLLPATAEHGTQLVATLPYEEIEGVRIGRDFHAGTLLGDDAPPQSSRMQVSKELTTLCPSCNGPINSSRPSCPHCGQLLAWN